MPETPTKAPPPAKGKRQPTYHVFREVEVDPSHPTNPTKKAWQPITKEPVAASSQKAAVVAAAGDKPEGTFFAIPANDLPEPITVKPEQQTKLVWS